MEFAVNPYKPGAGRKPPVLAGREDLTATIIRTMRQVAYEGEGDRPYVLWGLRGVGKTAVLRAIDDYAFKEGWLVISLEATPGESLARRLCQAAAIELRRYRGAPQVASDALRKAISVLRSFQLKVDPSGAYSFGVDIDPAAGFADSGVLSLDLQDLFHAIGEAARENGGVALLSIDEMQEAPTDDLQALNMALHAIGQGPSPVPLVLIGAGLPTLPGVLADATSYAERLYRFFDIGLLSDEDARKALALPARDLDVEWNAAALDSAVEAAGGYPYFIQQYGSCIWEVRKDAASIDGEDAAIGVAMAREEIERGLYRTRWDRATSSGRSLMKALAKLGSVASVTDIAEEMGKSSASDISPIRQRLIDDGQLYAPERGKLAFTVPGMGEYVLEAE